MTGEESDFADPIGMLGDCHRHIEESLCVLLRVSTEDAARELAGDHRSWFENALRYLRDTAPTHTADEEESLFPRLRSSNRIDLWPLLATIESLEEEHCCADRLHAEADALGCRWLEAGRLSVSEAQQFASALSRLEAIYRRHIRTEDTKVFPAAAAMLSGQERLAMGAEMRRRRRTPTDRE